MEMTIFYLAAIALYEMYYIGWLNRVSMIIENQLVLQWEKNHAE